MDTSTLSNIISKIAPSLGSVVSSVVPGAGLIINGIAALFGANKDDPNDIIKKINADPEAALKLIQFEKQNETEIQKLIVQDRMNAREREINFSKVMGKRDWIVALLACIITMGFFGIFTLVFFFHPDRAFNQTLSSMIGDSSAGMILILSYYFGSMNNR